MDENTLDNVLYELIISDLEGSISELEKNKLYRWKSLSKDNQEIYSRISAIYQDAELLHVYQKLDPQSSWDNFKVLIKGKNENVNHTVPVLDNNIISIIKIKWAAAVAASILFAAFLIFHNNKKNDNTFIASTGAHQQKKITLPDGSKILLKENTLITYNTETFDQTRVLEFRNGEAFFNIVHDAKRPLKIKLSEIEIEDIGTSFDIRKEKEKIFVFVSSGTVSLSNKLSGEKAMLIKGQKGICDLASKGIITKSNDELNYMAWADHNFQFIQASLAEVIKKLEEVYGTTILLDDEELKSKRLTISFQNQPIDSVLNIISQTMQIKVEKKDKDFHLKETPF